ncbi:hypothetical protein [Pedobacter sp. V48]|uniref:hypothetical protein n=1 Tax=Pedobacter sp. V48 TaxID=509635 RepID=UPI0003E53096|nr:hypothetical protein [Pedobacter sp. V48]ETZ24068.1 hypothetical protein N824_16145 [Pedobacter sp. V48]
MAKTYVNKFKLLGVLKQMDFDEEDIQHIAELDFSKYIVFSRWDEPEKVDFLTRISMKSTNVKLTLDSCF